MATPLVIAGLALVVALIALLALRGEVDARTEAWRRIAEERRWNWEQRDTAWRDEDTWPGGRASCE